MVDGETSILIIDASFLKISNQEAIVETLSFFSELTLIAAVESGETKNIVDLFQSFEIYRYIQKPFSSNQVKKCISAAARKHSKQKVDSISFNNDDSLVESSKNRYIIFAASLLLSIAFIFFLQKNKNTSIEASSISINEKQPASTEEVYNTSDLLALQHEPINLSAKTGLPATSNNNETNIINNAKKLKKIITTLNQGKTLKHL